jgi:steroid delta-isomerase-like uncharacterized protein
MSTPALVQAFYERIWNAGDLSASNDLLAEAFLFRGSLGVEHRGRDAFNDYVRSIRTALSNYLCDILDCVAEEDRAFAKMRFSGLHVADFRGFAPTGKPLQWHGAALFRFDKNHIVELWVLGDLAGLDSMLHANAR